MMALSGCTGRKRDLEFLKKRGHGRLITPTCWKNPVKDLPWGLDNGAFAAWKNGTPFPEKAFLKMLAKVPRAAPPMMAVCPDKVAGGSESLAFSVKWRKRLSALGYDWMPWYLAVQDGMGVCEVVDVITDKTGPAWAGIFVGGTMEWKRRRAEAWVNVAHRYGLKLHIGRVPQLADLVWAERIGADSVDSSNWARNDRHGLLDAAKEQASLYPKE